MSVSPMKSEDYPFASPLNIRRCFINYKPIEAKIPDRFRKLIEINRFTNVAIGAGIVACCYILVLLR